MGTCETCQFWERDMGFPVVSIKDGVQFVRTAIPSGRGHCTNQKLNQGFNKETGSDDMSGMLNFSTNGSKPCTGCDFGCIHYSTLKLDEKATP